MRANNIAIQRSNNIASLLLIVLAFLCFVSTPTFAETVESLIDKQELSLTMSLQTEGTIIPNQSVTFEIEVMSAQPFADNMTLSYVDITDAIVIPPSENTTLDIKTIDGKDWFVQQKKLVVYTMQNGEFVVPPVSVDVSINFKNKQKVKGQLKTKSQQFIVDKSPASLNGQEYLVSSNLVLTEQQKDASETKLEVGNAVTLTYKLTADNMHALLLPDFNIPALPGIKLYTKPIVKKDDVDRLSKLQQAIASQEVTFIFQQEGRYVIPEQKITWWNIKTKQPQQAIIAKQEFVVGDGGGLITENSQSNTDAELGSTNNYPVLQWLYIIVLIVFGIFILRAIYQHKQALMQSFKTSDKAQRNKLKQLYLKHIEEQNYQAAIMTLYQVINVIPDNGSANASALAQQLEKSPQQQALLVKLQRLAFAFEIKNNLSISTEEAKNIFNTLVKTKKISLAFSRFKFSMDLNNEQ
ncbi:hypothetical protein RGQ13_07690 [Thalassotalea psychrophila]|uniref:Protein BatD n=1 Tax=Thalassotalea psychrophila TaxID=3065647 RepID=A0ABY9TYF9_9GAMM|nr:hypothetical protein RGQ13_07690 [Colwelliaceae bacterium SQ149]